VAAYAPTHTPPYSGESYSPGVRTEYQAELTLLGYQVAELTVARYMHRASLRPSPTWRTFLTIHLRRGDISFRLFTTIATLGTPHDMTLQEIVFPEDDTTARMVQDWAAARRPS
jgi:hypothetical protein